MTDEIKDIFDDDEVYWEEYAKNTFRLPVDGGYVYKYYNPLTTAFGLVFVPNSSNIKDKQ